MDKVSFKEISLQEFDREMATTRKMLERVPFEKFDWAPHAKSMPLGRLAKHIAALPGMAAIILGTESHSFGGPGKPLEIASAADLVAHFDAKAKEARAALEGTTDEHLAEHWEMTFKSGDVERKTFEGPRALAFRALFIDHLIHHRAQLGVYLRLNDIAIPGSYGPSADETM